MKSRALLILAAPSFIAHLALAQLTATDVTEILHHAVARAVAISPNSVIAVTDREGNVLGVWVVRGGNANEPEIATAVSKAGTAAYLSSNQNAFTSRTAGFIIQQHFPPGVNNTAPGPLVGVGLSSLFVSDINTFRAPGSVIVFSPTPGAIMPPTYPQIKPVVGSSLDGSPGGVPLYKNGHLVGGIGVTGDGIPGPIAGFRAENPFIFISGYDKDEDVALAGQHGFAPSSGILATNVFIEGIRLPYVNSSTVFLGASQQGNVDSHYPIRAAPTPFAYPVETLGGVSGQIRQPIIHDPLAGTINGQPRLTAQEVRSILSYAAHQTSITRAAIRLPIGVPMNAFITVVNNPNTAGVAPTVLGTFRTGEATLFSWDVSVQKARTVIYYSSHDFLNFGLHVAMSVRAVGFLAQCNYPPGIDGNLHGPFNGQQEMFSGLSGNHCNPHLITPGGAPNPSLPNGITIFPGAFGLYRNGVLIGAIGVSGDGVDQDDLVAAAGTHDFLAPLSIRADHFFFRGTRLPYAKFPRDPGPPSPPPTATPRPTVTPTATPTPTPAVSDFNRDGHPGYLLFNSTSGATVIWYMNNNVLIGGAAGPTLPAGWSLAALADFNLDGYPDYLLYNPSTGGTVVWYMRNNVLIGAAPGPGVPAGWTLVGAADFNRDGHPDYLLFGPTSHATVIWYMNNNVHIGGAAGPTLPAGWSVAALADFNGDGRPDYLLFNASTLQTVIWYMNNNVHVAGAYGPTLPAGWSLVGAADFNADAKPDFLLFNASTLQTVIWYMNNNVHIAGAYGPTLPAGWSVVAP